MVEEISIIDAPGRNVPQFSVHSSVNFKASLLQESFISRTKMLLCLSILQLPVHYQKLSKSWQEIFW